MVQAITYKDAIAILIPWYGTFPWYFSFFVHSLRYNPSIDFFIITDEAVTIDLPPNIKLISKSFSELKELLERKLGFAISLEKPYKLCDFKPAYGLVFEDYLQEYQFWGHGDIDVVFGDIRNFITDDILSKNDFVSIRHDYISGYFALYRNDQKMKQLFTKSKDFKKVMTEEKNFCFDECNYLHSYLYRNIPIAKLSAEIESMDHVVRRESISGRITAHYNFFVTESAPGCLRWTNGRLFYKEKYEVICFHLMRFKKLPYVIPCCWPTVPDTFFIHVFYFSRHPPQTVKAIVEKMKFYCQAFIPYKIKLMTKWTGLTLVAQTTKPKEHGNKGYKKYLGIYQCYNTTIHIAIDDAAHRLFMILDNWSVIPLKYIDDNTLVSEWSYGCKLNFNYSKGTSFLLKRLFREGCDEITYHKIKETSYMI